MLGYGTHLDLNFILKLMLVMILPFLGLFFWLENKLSNSNEVNHYSHGNKLVQTSDEMNNLIFEKDEKNTIPGVLSAHCACSFCGRLSNIVTTCSQCKSALYCSNACYSMHQKSCHRYKCVEIEVAQDQEESSSHGTWLFMEPGNETSNYTFNEVDYQKTDMGNIYYIERGEKQNNIEYFSDESVAMAQHGIVTSNDGCAVCGNPSSKICSRCKAIKYCSRTCQHFDWRSGHKFQCFIEEAHSSQAAKVNQERPVHEYVVNHTYSYEVEDNDNSSGPLRLEFYSEGNPNPGALILSSLSQEATNNDQKEVEEQLLNLKEELAKIKDENTSLVSERDKWEMRARNSIERLHSFRKENEHQLFILKHENELVSNAEKQARQMVNSLSQRLQSLQITVETGVAKRKTQEEYICMLQNECAKAKIDLQEQNKCVERLTLELDNKAIQFPERINEETRQKFVNAFSTIAAVESNVVGTKVSQPISLSRNPTFTRQSCSICLTNEKDVAFGCGHMTCRECGSKIRKCHICRKKITNRIRLFPG